MLSKTLRTMRVWEDETPDLAKSKDKTLEVGSIEQLSALLSLPSFVKCAK